MFGRALELGLGLDDLLQLRSERFVVVRNPYTRLASAFRYICRSNELGASWFLAPRLRAEAITGLDWTTMANSAEGFRRFLAYIEAEIATEGPHSLNPHWCIQAVSGFPGPYNPTLTGRVEALGAFFTEVARRLGAPMPEGHFHANRQVHDDDLAQDPPARRLIERIYADDFETFGY